MPRSRRGSTFFSPIRRKTRFERFKEFLWQPETKQFLGRTGTGWALVLTFYCLLYIFLALFFAVMMFGLNATLNDDMPKYILDGSPIGQTPGLSFRPVYKETDLSGITIIEFDPSDNDTWKHWVDQIKEELMTYNNSNVEVCDYNETTSKEKGCRFELANLGSYCSEMNDFGYSAGEPCFLLRLNKLLGWEPKPLDSNSAKIKDYKSERSDNVDLNPNYVGISCSTSKVVDRHLLGNVTFYPKEGFSKKFFPYWNQKDYQSPLVMAKFQGLERDTLVKLECKPWAKNVEYDRTKKRGFIRFDVKIKGMNEVM